MLRVFLPAVLALLLVVGCAQGGPDVVKNLGDRITRLEASVDSAKAYADLLEQRIISLELDRPAKNGLFHPNETGYQLIYSDSGLPLAVSLQSVTPYANGYKARFHFGNPHAMDFEDVDLAFTWGPPYPAKGASEQALVEWRKQQQSGKQMLSKRLRAGSWNPVEIVIAPANAAQIGSIEITGVVTSRVFMRQ
jgi:hypothetical protein